MSTAVVDFMLQRMVAENARAVAEDARVAAVDARIAPRPAFVIERTTRYKTYVTRPRIKRKTIHTSARKNAVCEPPHSQKSNPR